MTHARSILTEDSSENFTQAVFKWREKEILGHQTFKEAC